MTEKLRKNSNENDRETRSRDEYSVPNYKKSITQKSLFFKGLKLFNSFIKEFEKSNEKFHIFICNFVKQL